MRILLLVSAALIVAAGAGFYVLQSLGPSTQPVETAEAKIQAPTTTEVFAPAQPLSVGTILKPEHLGRIAMPPSAVTDEMVVADEAGQQALIGSVARQVLSQGVPIARSAVVQPGERGFLAAVLPKGKRAISIPIGEVAGISGLVMPGDRVDIILTYSVAGGAVDAGRDIRASETVIGNLRVLALDQRLQTGGGAEAVAETPIARTATLEVTPQQAEMITLATTLGDLSLVLNSVRDGGEPTAYEAVKSGAPRALTLDSDVSSLLRRQLADRAGEVPALPAADRIDRIQVVRGIVANDFELTPDAPTAAAEPVAAAAETVGDGT